MRGPCQRGYTGGGRSRVLGTDLFQIIKIGQAFSVDFLILVKCSHTRSTTFPIRYIPYSFRCINCTGKEEIDERA